MSDEAATIEAAAPAPAPAPTGPLESVGAAVAELERRAAERRAAAQSQKAERDEAVAAKRQAAQAEMDRMEAEREGRAVPRADEADDDTEDDAPEVEASDDEDQDSAPEDAEEATADEEPDEPAVKAVRIDGEEIEIPKGTPRALVEKVQKLAGDLKADYTRKTQELAAVKQTAAQRAQAAEEALQRTVQAQKAIMAVAQQWVGEPPPLSLAQHDPGAYTVQRALYDQRLAQLQAVAQQGRGLTEAQQKAQAEAQKAALQEEARKMVEKLPELAKEEARSAFLNRAVQAVSDIGFSAEDVASVTDHRMLLLLHKLVAAQTRLAAIDKAGASTKARLANVPPKALKPGVATTPEQQRSDRTKKAKAEFLRGPRDMQSVRRLIDAGLL